MRTIAAATVASALLLAAPAAASTLTFAGGDYTWTGTRDSETLNVLPGPDADTLIFVDREGNFTASPAECTAVSASELRCPAPSGAIVIHGGDGDDQLGTPDRRRTALTVPFELDGGDHADKLRGGRGDDVLDGGRSDDELIGGLGDDTFDGGKDLDTVLHDYDGRNRGVTVDVAAAGPEPGDAYAGIENLGGTRFDDDLTLAAGFGGVFGGGGDDFIDISRTERADARCGGGEDVVSPSLGARAFGCEHVGATADPDDWVSGFFFVSGRFTSYFDGAIELVGYAPCAANRGERCKLDVSFTFERSRFVVRDSYVVKRGQFADVEAPLSAAQRATLRAAGKQYARLRARLRSPGLPAVKLSIRVRVDVTD
jgi:hypothetical protein